MRLSKIHLGSTRSQASSEKKTESTSTTISGEKNGQWKKNIQPSGKRADSARPRPLGHRNRVLSRSEEVEQIAERDKESCSSDSAGDIRVPDYLTHPEGQLGGSANTNRSTYLGTLDPSSVTTITTTDREDPSSKLEDSSSLEDKVSPDSSSLREAQYRNRDTPGKNDDFQKDLDEMLSGLLEKPNSGDLSHISDPEGNRSSSQPDVGGKVARQRLNFIVPRALVKRNERKNNARRREFSKAPHHERLDSKPLSAAAQQKLAFARDILPAGVRIGRNGRLEGTVLISETPSQIRENKARGRTGRAETLQKMTFAESLKQAAEVYLTNVNDKIEGLALTNQAGVTGDLGRIDIEFLDSDGSSLFHSVDIDES